MGIYRFVIVLGIVSIFSKPFGAAKLYSQTIQDEDNFYNGIFYLDQKDYKKALSYLLKLKGDLVDNSQINYLIGECYVNIQGEQNKSLEYLEKAVIEIDEKYFSPRLKNTGAPAIAWITLGDVYHRKNMLKKASYAYHKYKSYLSQKDEDKIKEINRRIRGLGMTYESQRSPSNVEIVNLGSDLNSNYSDYNPVLSGDQKTLVYTSYWKNRDKIYVSYHDELGNWQPPKDITAHVGSKGNTYTTSLSYDGKELYLVQISEFSANIYVSKLNKGRWSKMQTVPGKVNSKYFETNACISADGQSLFFSSDRGGGEGGLDLYVAFNDDGLWKGIKNLGPIINTSYDEDAPYIDNEGKTLYFSSGGHESVGKMDILYSKLNDNNEWGHPQNLGLPYNTVDDDVFFRQFGKAGYLARDKEGGFGKNDIYMIRVADIPEEIEDNIYNETSVQVETIDSPLDSSYIATIGIVESDEDIYGATTTTEAISLILEEPTSSKTSSQMDTESYSKYSSENYLFTIQIMALQKHREISLLRGFNELKLSRGEDGYYRYTVGEYSSIKQAQQDIKTIWQQGYKNAYIRSTKSISNY